MGSEIVLLVVGLVLGWAFGFGSQEWRDRREARAAARMIYGEISACLARLRQLQQEGLDRYELFTSLPATLDLPTEHWHAHGLVVLRLVDTETASKIVVAFRAVESAERMLRQAGELWSRLDPTHADYPEHRADFDEIHNGTDAKLRHQIDAVARGLELLRGLANRPLVVVRFRRSRAALPTEGQVTEEDNEKAP